MNSVIPLKVEKTILIHLQIQPLTARLMTGSISILGELSSYTSAFSVRRCNSAWLSMIPKASMCQSFCIILLTNSSLEVCFPLSAVFDSLLEKLRKSTCWCFLLGRYKFCSLSRFCSRSFEGGKIESFLLITACNSC